MLGRDGVGLCSVGRGGGRVADTGRRPPRAVGCDDHYERLEAALANGLHLAIVTYASAYETISHDALPRFHLDAERCIERDCGRSSIQP